MAINFSGIVGNLQGLGFYDFVLPWLLFFAVILGALNAAKVFGEPEKAGRINAIIAAVVAFFAVAFTPAGTTLAGFLVPLFGAGGMFIAALLLLVILGGVLGFSPTQLIAKDKEGQPHPWAKPLIGLALLLLVAWIFSATTGTSIGLVLPGLDSATWTIIFIAVFVLLVIWYATKPAEKAAG